MICDNCHAANSPGAKFCSVCGAPLPEKALVHQQGQETMREPRSEYSYDDGFNAKRVGHNDSHSSNQNRRVEYEYYPEERYWQNAENNAVNVYANNPNYNYSEYIPPRSDPLYQNRLRQRSRKRSAAAIAFYMISGIFALVSLILPLLPSIDRWGGVSFYTSGDRYINVFQYSAEAMGTTGGSSRIEVQLVGVILISLFISPMFFQLLWAIFSFTRVRAAGIIGMIGSCLYLSASVYWMLYLLNVVPVGRYYYTGFSRAPIDTSAFLTVVPYLMCAASVIGIIFSAVQISQRGRVR